MFNSIVYAMSSIEAVTPPSPKAVGVYSVVSPNLTVFLLTLPLVAVTVRLTGYKQLLSYSDTLFEVKLYIYNLKIMLEVSKTDTASGFAVAFKKSQTLQLGKLGLFI